jgi:enoyl-CoA hydratase/carnithine racemase
MDFGVNEVAFTYESQRRARFHDSRDRDVKVGAEPKRHFERTQAFLRHLQRGPAMQVAALHGSAMAG